MRCDGLNPFAEGRKSARRADGIPKSNRYGEA
jgi:hypothetical protein